MTERTRFALEAIQEGANISELCECYGISRPTGYKWLKRYLDEGARGMRDQSRRPTSSPTILDEEVTCRIVKLHNQYGWGPLKIHELYRRNYGEPPSLSSVKRIFEKSGLVKKRRRRSQSQSGRIYSDVEAKSCNDVWTVDFKGGWTLRNFGYCEPLTVRDEHSRYVLEVRVLRSNSNVAVQTAFTRLFEQYGLPSYIRSDNGTPFASGNAVLGLTKLSAWWLALGINLERGRPGKPQDNGAHERMHKDIKRELQYNAEADPIAQQHAFDIWRETFNEIRPHEALGMQTPAEVYRKSKTLWEGTPDQIDYPKCESRKIDKHGNIKFGGRRIIISSALAGWNVGLQPDKNNLLKVLFANLLIGHIDTETGKFLWATSSPKELRSTQRKTQ